MRIPPRKLLQMMPSLCHVHGGLGPANRSQTSVDELLQSIAEFGPCLDERTTNSHHDAVLQSDCRHQRAEIRHFRDHLDVSEEHRHQLSSELRAAQA